MTFQDSNDHRVNRWLKVFHRSFSVRLSKSVPAIPTTGDNQENSDGISTPPWIQTWQPTERRLTEATLSGSENSGGDAVRADAAVEMSYGHPLLLKYEHRFQHPVWQPMYNLLHTRATKAGAASADPLPEHNLETTRSSRKHDNIDRYDSFQWLMLDERARETAIDDASEKVVDKELLRMAAGNTDLRMQIQMLDRLQRKEMLRLALWESSQRGDTFLKPNVKLAPVSGRSKETSPERGPGKQAPKAETLLEKSASVANIYASSVGQQRREAWESNVIIGGAGAATTPLTCGLKPGTRKKRQHTNASGPNMTVGHVRAAEKSASVQNIIAFSVDCLSSQIRRVFQSKGTSMADALVDFEDDLGQCTQLPPYNVSVDNVGNPQTPVSGAAQSGVLFSVAKKREASASLTAFSALLQNIGEGKENVRPFRTPLQSEIQEPDLSRTPWNKLATKSARNNLSSRRKLQGNSVARKIEFV